MVREALAMLEEGVNDGGVLIKSDDQTTLAVTADGFQKTDGTDGPSGKELWHENQQEENEGDDDK